MNAVIVLLTLSALIGFALGKSFSWRALAAASIGIAVLSSVTLQIKAFGAVPGIAIVFACLALSQAAYIAAGWVSLSDKKTDEEPRDRRGDDVGHNHEHQKAPSWLA
jgi:hypothetical protein